MTRDDGRQRSVGVFGLLSWDYILVVDSYPGEGDYRITRHTSWQPGGTTGNTSVALARLGADVSIASRVGDDASGRRVLADLAREGCDLRHVKLLLDEPTDESVVVVSGTGTGSERTVYWVQGARLKHGHHLPIEEFFARDLVFLDVDDPRLRLFLLDLPMHVSPRTRILGAMTYLGDLEPSHGLELALRHDYLAGSATEIQYLTEQPTLESAVERFQQEMVLSQVRFAAISNGASGSLIVTRDDVTEIPAFEVDVVDPTGAGDAFAAGVAYGILQNWERIAIGRFANAVGALATRGFGGQASLPTLDEVNAFMDSALVR